MFSRMLTPKRSGSCSGGGRGPRSRRCLSSTATTVASSLPAAAPAAQPRSCRAGAARSTGGRQCRRPARSPPATGSSGARCGDAESPLRRAAFLVPPHLRVVVSEQQECEGGLACHDRNEDDVNERCSIVRWSPRCAPEPDGPQTPTRCPASTTSEKLRRTGESGREGYAKLRAEGRGRGTSECLRHTQTGAAAVQSHVTLRNSRRPCTPSRGGFSPASELGSMSGTRSMMA